MRESKFVKVMGILAIIFGGIGILMSLISFVGVVSTSGVYYAWLGISKGGLLVSVIFALLADVVMLFSGLLGLKNWNRPTEVSACIGASMVTLIIMVIANLIAIIAGKMSVLTLLSGLAIPVLSLIAAIQFRNHAAGGSASSNM